MIFSEEKSAPILAATSRMETGTRNAISIKLNRTFTSRPKLTNDSEMGISRLLPDDLWKKECPNAETKPHLVTSIRNNTSSSPYFRVTGKWTVQKKAREFPTYGACLRFCFLIFLLTVNLYFFQKFHKQYSECLQAVTMLENMVKHLEEETRDLQEQLNGLPRTNRPSTNPPSFHTATEVSFDLHTGQSSIDFQNDVMRTKRSTDERSDRKDRKKKTVAVQFSGSRPYGFYMVPPEGILGPWIESTNDFSNIEKFGAKLRDHNSSLEIDKDGLYMIYAQVTYQSINVSNSFSINVIPNTDRLLSQPITTCSSFGKIAKDGEISCYTSVVKLLNAGDIVFVQQAQPDREIIFTKTYTYFGLVHLN